MPSLQGLQPADYAVIGSVGLTAILGLAACLYAVPWRRGAPKATRGFNVLWRGRAALSLVSVLWVLSQLLRVSSIWGANSFVFSVGVTGWTGAGWMCRIYLTASLGILAPFCACFALLMLTAALSRRHRPQTVRHPNARLLGLALLCTLPVATVQAVIAWLGLVVHYKGQPFEAAPRSVLGYFFATYWEGNPQECGVPDGSNGAGETATSAGPVLLPATGQVAAAGQLPALLASIAPNNGMHALTAAATGAMSTAAHPPCTLCVFPAAAVITHAVFSLAFLVALWVTSSRLAAAVLNMRLKRRMRLFQLAYSLLVLAGLAAMGVSIVQGPFTWLNQACWLVYVGSVLAAALLVTWEVVVWPVRDLRAVDKRLAAWDATTAAYAAAADDMESQGSGSGLIKAHNRTQSAEAVAQAAAATVAARTVSMSAASTPVAGGQLPLVSQQQLLASMPVAGGQLPPVSQQQLPAGRKVQLLQ